MINAVSIIVKKGENERRKRAGKEIGVDLTSALEIVFYRILRFFFLSLPADGRIIRIELL